MNILNIIIAMNMLTNIYTTEEIMFDLLSKVDVVFIGEQHDNKFDHEIELLILKELSKRRKVVLSLEMFEKDVQNIVDDYLQKRITEEQFLSRSRPWPNYKSDYRPLIEYARENGIPVIASNIPRKIANEIARQKPISDSTFLPDTVFLDDVNYKKRFFETMMKMGHVNDVNMVANYYKSQCYKDGVMAHSIIEYLDKYPDHLIISINGNFHSDFHSGIPYQLSKINSNLKIFVITIKDQKVKNAGDFIIERSRKSYETEAAE